jgi:hypothetical protein
MVCLCEVLWGRVGPHKTGDKIDLSETDADRLQKMGAVRVLFKTAPAPEPETPDSEEQKPAPDPESEPEQEPESEQESAPESEPEPEQSSEPDEPPKTRSGKKPKK